VHARDVVQRLIGEPGSRLPHTAGALQAQYWASKHPTPHP
jgi:hypothetical protein